MSKHGLAVKFLKNIIDYAHKRLSGNRPTYCGQPPSATKNTVAIKVTLLCSAMQVLI